MKRILTVAVLLLTGISTASAAVVTGLPNILIVGTYYDVTIHTTGSFNEIWNINGDWIFGEGDASIINAAPKFWSYAATALLAANAVIVGLGSIDTWGWSDATQTPYAYSNKGTPALLAY